jgi:putative spermidine/putrescine transport system permease protein
MADAFGAGRRHGGAYRLMIAPAVLLVGAFYVVPILRVLVISVTELALGFANLPVRRREPGDPPGARHDVRGAVLTSALALLLGYVLAYFLTVTRPGLRRIAMFCVLVPFWLSVLVRAFAWITILRKEGVLNSALIGSGLIDEPLSLVYNRLGVVIGMVHYMTPYAVLVLYAHMQSIDRRLTDAARILGASPAQAFWRVFAPLSLPGLLAATILVFIFSLGFYVTPALLGAGKTIMIAEYVGVQIETTLRWGVATAMSGVLLGSVLLLVVALGRVMPVQSLLGGGVK